MWTRSLLKENAKQALRGRYWRCFVVCLIVSLLGGGFVAAAFVPEGKAWLFLLAFSLPAMTLSGTEAALTKE